MARASPLAVVASLGAIDELFREGLTSLEGGADFRYPPVVNEGTPLVSIITDFRAPPGGDDGLDPGLDPGLDEGPEPGLDEGVLGGS